MSDNSAYIDLEPTYAVALSLTVDHGTVEVTDGGPAFAGCGPVIVGAQALLALRPAGPQGATGLQGPAGPQGPTGPPACRSDRADKRNRSWRYRPNGAYWPDGADRATGATGVGATGPTGATGTAGATGPTGAMAAPGLLARPAQGPVRGAQGPTGPHRPCRSDKTHRRQALPALPGRRVPPCRGCTAQQTRATALVLTARTTARPTASCGKNRRFVELHRFAVHACFWRRHQRRAHKLG